MQCNNVSNSKWTHSTWNVCLQSAAAPADVIVFSTYADTIKLKF